MHHQDEGGIGKSIPDGRKISRDPRDFPRAKPEGNFEGMDFPIPPSSWWSTDILSASIFLQGVDQEILPCGQGRIDSIKINPSLLMMREWDVWLVIRCIIRCLLTGRSDKAESQTLFVSIPIKFEFQFCQAWIWSHLTRNSNCRFNQNAL